MVKHTMVKHTMVKHTMVKHTMVKAGQKINLTNFDEWTILFINIFAAENLCYTVLAKHK